MVEIMNARALIRGNTAYNYMAKTLDIVTLAIKQYNHGAVILTLTLPGPSAGVSGSLDSYCSFKTLMLGHGGSSAGSYLADPTSPIPSHWAVIILFQSVTVHQLP